MTKPTEQLIDEKERNGNFVFVMQELGAARPTEKPEKWEWLLTLIEQKCRAREAEAYERGKNDGYLEDNGKAYEQGKRDGAAEAIERTREEDLKIVDEYIGANAIQMCIHCRNAVAQRIKGKISLRDKHLKEK